MCPLIITSALLGERERREERGEREVERGGGLGERETESAVGRWFSHFWERRIRTKLETIIEKKKHLQNASHPNFHSPPPPPPPLLIFSVGPSRTMQFVVFIHISEINGSLVLALKIFSSAEPLSAKGDK